MSTLLAPSDPYSILHACIWDRPERESVFIKPETIDVPAQEDLTLIRPVTYNLLDFGPNLSIFPDDRSNMLVRDEYLSLWKWIEEDRHTSGRQFGGVVVTGHPGIGKSFFLYYYLVKNLLAGQPTALQTDKNSFFLFIDKGVYLIRFSSSTPMHDIQSHLKSLGCKKGIIALVDASEKIPSPAAVFIDSRFPFYVTLATSSPRSSRWKEWTEQRYATTVVMQPWSWSEIFIGGTNFTERCPSGQELHDVFERYGPSIRVCFDLAGDQRRIELYDRTLRRSIVNFPSFASAIQDYGLAETPVDPSIFLMVPDSSRLPLVTFVSKYVVLLATQQLPGMYLDGIRELHKLLESKAETKPGAKCLCEAGFHRRLFYQGYRGGLYTLPRPERYQDRPCIPPNATIIRHLSVAMLQRPLELEYYVFDSPQSLTLSSFVVTNFSDERVFLFKITHDLHSPVRLAELDALADKMPEEFIPHPDHPIHWNLVFVIPKALEDKFQAQPYKGVSKRHWKIEGYIHRCNQVIGGFGY